MRRLTCKECLIHWIPPNPLDVAEGWRIRVVEAKAKMPFGHGISIVTRSTKEFYPASSLVCDDCNAKIEDGAVAYFVTMYKEDEPEIENWEKEFFVTGENGRTLDATK